MITLSITLAALWLGCGAYEMHLHTVWWHRAFPRMTWHTRFVPDNLDTIFGYAMGPIGLAIGEYERRHTRMY